MTTSSLPARHPSVIPRPELHIAGKVCVASLVLLGLGALAGGVALVMQPDGSVMHFEVAILAGSPFADFLVPGLILGGLFGIGLAHRRGDGHHPTSTRTIPGVRDRMRPDDLDRGPARDHQGGELGSTRRSSVSASRSPRPRCRGGGRPSRRGGLPTEDHRAWVTLTNTDTPPAPAPAPAWLPPRLERALTYGRALAAGDADGDRRADLYIVRGGNGHNPADALLLNRRARPDVRSMTIPQTRLGDAEDASRSTTTTTA